MDADIADQILGRPLVSFTPEPATLTGYKRVYVADATYPGIVQDPDSTVDGILARDVSAEEVERLNTFEGPDYDTHNVSVRVASGEQIEARVFVPVPSLALTNTFWSLEDWQAAEKATFLDGMTRGELV